MKQREHTFVHFLFFLFASVVVFVLLRLPLFQYVQFLSEQAVLPFQKLTFRAVRFLPEVFADSQKKVFEQKMLQESFQNAQYEKLRKENAALLDQFQTAYPKNQDLLLAVVLGAPEFIPNVSFPSEFIIDKGKRDAVVIGQGVVYKNNVIGKIRTVSQSVSVVNLITNTSFSLPAKTAKTRALGLLRGSGNDTMLFENVLLSEELRIGDLVVTIGDINQKGIGLPPDLVIGKILSIDKKPSALFQAARVQTLVDLQRVTNVFLVNTYRK